MLRCPFFLWFFNLKHPPITLCSLCQGQKVEKTVTFYQHKCLFIYRVHKATPLPPPLFLGGEIFEKSREVQDFLVKIKGDPYRVTGCLKGEGGGVSTSFQCMDFVIIMLFTQQVFYLRCLFFFWLLLKLEIVIISDQISAWCRL